MKTIYLVKKNPNLSAEENWIKMNGSTFYKFIKSPEGQRRKSLFVTLPACGKKDYAIVIEAEPDVAKEINSENNHRKHLNRVRAKKGYVIISYHAIQQTDEDFYGEELLLDDAISVEDMAIHKIEIESLYEAISCLSWEDQQYIIDVYLSKNPITDIEYAERHGLTQWQVVYMKEKIFQGLRIQMRNICELFPIGDENFTNAQ